MFKTTLSTFLNFCCGEKFKLSTELYTRKNPRDYMFPHSFPHYPQDLLLLLLNIFILLYKEGEMKNETYL